MCVQNENPWNTYTTESFKPKLKEGVSPLSSMPIADGPSAILLDRKVPLRVLNNHSIVIDHPCKNTRWV
jgi:hypothetical protein